MNIEINTDNNLLQNRTKSTNCDGLSVSKKIDLFERYLKENSNESIHSNTIFEGYNIGRILIQLRYLMKNNLIKYNSEEFKRMENLGLLENTKETIYVKIKRLKQFCEKHPYAFSNIYRLRKDLNKKEKMEFEKVFKDYTYIRERKSRGKLPQKLEEELNNSQIGGVFKKEDIGELYEKYEIGDKEKRLPGNIHFSFRYVAAEPLLIMLDQKGICVSAGSACASGSIDPSHVLLATGVPKDIAKSSIRMTIGEDITKEEADYAVDELKAVVERLRSMSPEYAEYIASQS